MADSELSQQELDERVAILKRLRQLLEQQRSKFQEYLVVLEKQETSISNDNDESLVAQAELEQQIVSNISNLQRVIVPMEDLYKSKGITENSEIPQLKADLSKLQQEVLSKNEKNRTLLKEHIIQIRNKINLLNNPLKNPYANKRNTYSSNNSTASIIDVEI